MKLIVISNPLNLNNEQELICSMFEAGLDHFHLRKPAYSKEEMEHFISLIPSEYYNRIILHTHHELVEQYKLKGVHGKLPIKKNAEHSVSTSFHSVRECISCNEEYDYAFLSPVFDSISKKGYGSSFNKNELVNFFKERSGNNKIIALGGIDEQNADTAIEYGFDGVAVLGSIWMAVDPVSKFKRLLDITNSFS